MDYYRRKRARNMAQNKFTHCSLVSDFESWYWSKCLVILAPAALSEYIFKEELELDLKANRVLELCTKQIWEF